MGKEQLDILLQVCMLEIKLHSALKSKITPNQAGWKWVVDQWSRV